MSPMYRNRIVFMMLLVACAGCARSEKVVEAPSRWDEGAVRTHLRQLTQPVAVADSARAVRRVLYAMRQMEIAGLMPAREPSFLMAMGNAAPPTEGAHVDPSQAHVLGYVTGRHPSYYDELVIVAVDLDRPAAAAALEVARVLVREARDTQVPERTVLFALWSPPRSGVLGMRDFLANPTWGLDGIARVLFVASDTAAVAESRQLLNTRGIASEVVTTSRTIALPTSQPDVSEAVTLANTTLLANVLYDRLRAVAIVEDSSVAGRATE